MHHAGRIFVGSMALMATALLGACGSDDDTGGGTTTDADVTVVAKDSLEFDKDSYTVPAGEVGIAYENGGSMAHTLLIEGVDDFKLKVSGSGDTDDGTVTLEPGEYTIYCDVPGHESMKATLTVE